MLPNYLVMLWEGALRVNKDYIYSIWQCVIFGFSERSLPYITVLAQTVRKSGSRHKDTWSVFRHKLYEELYNVINRTAFISYILHAFYVSANFQD